MKELSAFVLVSQCVYTNKVPHQSNPVSPEAISTMYECLAKEINMGYLNIQ